MNKTLINLWRAELRKEAALWLADLSPTDKVDFFAGDKTEEEVVEELVISKMTNIQQSRSVGYQYEKYGYQ